MTDLENTDRGRRQEKLRRVGNYVLLKRLARGGMGEVYLAKHGSVAGMEKLCVLKMVRPEYSQDQEYVGRFMDEARVVVRLSHRNVGQVFDVGRADDRLYMGMEFIIGHDLKTMAERAQERGVRISEAVALHISNEILEGLAYAHRQSDPQTGAALHIVHRDVSPQNVMVSFEGEVKLIDFGLAASTVKTERTAVNTVMGKLAYMSPEQARGEGVDARTDLFAAAQIAYELVRNRRYYGDMTLQQIWEIVGRGRFRPDDWNKLPKGLRRVLERALSKDRDDRYPRGEDLREALEAYAFARGMRASPGDVRALMLELFPEGQAPMRDLLRAFMDVNVHDARPDDTRMESFAQSDAVLADASLLTQDDSALETAPPARPVDTDAPSGGVHEAETAKKGAARGLAGSDDAPVSSEPPATAQPDVTVQRLGPAAPTMRSASPPLAALAGGGALAALLVLGVAFWALSGEDSDEPGGDQKPPTTAGDDATQAPDDDATRTRLSSKKRKTIAELAAETAATENADAAIDPTNTPPVVDDKAPTKGSAKKAKKRRRRRGRKKLKAKPPALTASLDEKRRFLSAYCRTRARCAERLLDRGDVWRMTLQERRDHEKAVNGCLFTCAK